MKPEDARDAGTPPVERPVRPHCCKCGLPIHEGQAGLRHYGTGTAHPEYVCLTLLHTTIRVLQDREASSVADERARCARIALNGCLVPPDGGSPTEDERRLCEEIARRILEA